MPKLWNETIEAHRAAVRDAILDAAWALVVERGLMSVTMAGIAERAAIGRATVYKYFTDVESVLAAWHERQVAAHLQQLAEIANRPGAAGSRLEAVLAAYARILRGRGEHGPDLGALLHRDGQPEHAQRHLADLVRALLEEGVGSGEFRADVPAGELARYCLHALSAAAGMASEAAVVRLAGVVMSGVAAGG
ncbi:TetR/AcrR family transcriptional regulator [Nonomuraea endophytica]|uniref:AcrR family transcriptional regulator n=1 Tax=Nonomuraea endophytica TaxID=714136 RepID=A0A7W8A5G0_9ACTN|nr:TetR/AcrR family transcriptional regulator [Nonomuraea endophytica]MBB5079205.1 AcrR family transcriptional regulator [Nonomuraea endophytica]